MSYLALYRKYRPVDFNDFAGQTEISESLRYQVKTSTFGHSYIFNGIRGTGKTSMAKVFSKAINCLNPKDGNPCGECESCTAFQENGLMDIIEIDAASNNGVDDIRELRENSYFVPAYSKYKVYIIDEVQMLSKEAFNALLKTLEEPSKQVVFILATTELHKIPETILSRCQRYTFRRVDENAMVERMAMICNKENVEYDTSALQVISEHSDGAMRDALSLMDKALALSRGHLTETTVRESLGLLGREKVHQLMLSMFQGDVDELIISVDSIIREGKEIGAVFEEILIFLRGILLSKYVNNEQVLTGLLNYSIKQYSVGFNDVSAGAIQEAMEILDKHEKNLRYQTIPRLSLEMALIEIATKNTTHQVTEVKRVLKERKVEVVKEEVPPPKEIPQNDHNTYWQKVLADIKSKKEASLYYLLAEAKLKNLNDNEIHIAFPEGDAFSPDAVEQEDNMKIIQDSMNKVFSRPMKLIVEQPQLQVRDELDVLKAFMGTDLDKLKIK